MFDIRNMMEVKSTEPFLGETFIGVATGLITHPSSYSDMEYWIERTPECLAILRAIVTDIKSDGYRLIGGKQQMNKANEFILFNDFDEVFDATIMDWLIYGDSYIWKGFSIDGKEISYSQLKNQPIELKERYPYVVKHIPSSTMNIHADADGRRIGSYEQIVGSRTAIWQPDDIIHAKLIPWKGKLYSYSPLQASLVELQTLAYIKDYASNFFKNGGVPDWIFKLPKELSGSPNHKALIQMLSKYKSSANLHGSLVFCGEVEHDRINEINKDMEFRQLAIYLTGVLALAFGMPVSRIASIIGAEVRVTAGSDDAAIDAYWSSISAKQSYFENLFNKNIFKPLFNIELKFNKSYKQNEFREMQRNVMAADFLKLCQSMGISFNQAYIERLLYLRAEDIESYEPEQEEKTGLERQAQMTKQKVERGLATESYSQQKKKQQQSVKKPEQIPKEEKSKIKQPRGRL